MKNVFLTLILIFSFSVLCEFWYSEINDARIMTDIDIDRLTND